MKKKTLSILLTAAVVLSLAACGKGAEESADTSAEAAQEQTSAEPESPEEEKPGDTDVTPQEEETEAGLAGGWQVPESVAITPELRELFDRATEGLLGAEHIPVACVGRQVVAGTNYRFLCRTSPAVPDPVETWTIATVCQDPQGNAELLGFEESNVATRLSELMGGWRQAESPDLTEEVRAAFDRAMEAMVGVDYVPIALLSTQVVSGTNYCIFCEATVVYPGAEPYYAFVTVCQDLQGNAEIYAIEEFGMEPVEEFASQAVWKYEYAGVEHPYLVAVTDYLREYGEENLVITGGLIPCVTSLQIDNDDSSDIRMWGIFDIYNYSLRDYTLVEESGERLLGLFHLSQAADGTCAVTGTEFVEEGDDAAIEALCAGYDLALNGLKDPVVTEETRRWYISQFVRAEGLDAVQYQPAGCDPVPLEYEAQESPEWVAALPEADQTDSLIVVDITVGSNAILTMHEKNSDGVWMQTLDEAAFIGKNGPGKTREGDLRTPIGTFGFNAAFGINDDPGCALGYVKVDDTYYWVADSNSDRYNTMVSTRDYTDFNTGESEHLIEMTNAYKYALNTTYNEECEPGKGSAIFLHCYREERTYTGGCISIPLEKMEYVMRHVQAGTKIIIRMAPGLTSP